MTIGDCYYICILYKKEQKGYLTAYCISCRPYFRIKQQ